MLLSNHLKKAFQRPKDTIVDGFRWDFYISFIPSDREWGERVARILEPHYGVALPGHEPESAYQRDLAEILSASRRVIPILSPASVEDTFEEAIWQTLCSIDPLAKERRVIPVKVSPCKPRGLLGTIVPVDLTRAADKAAYLLEEMRVTLGGRRGAASPPPFPPSKRSK